MQILRIGRFIFNNDTKMELENSDGILYKGEMAIESDTQLMKVGDGKTKYKDLPYLNRGEKGDKPVVTISDHETWMIDGVDTKLPTRGRTGAAISIKSSLDKEGDLPQKGEQGDAYMINGDLYIWDGATWKNSGRIQGPEGKQGLKGDKGDTPVLKISSAGTWVVDGVDTGNPARGPKGDTGSVGPRGFKGEKGDTSVLTISEAGTWMIDGVDTGNPARGPQGDPATNLVQSVNGKTGSVNINKEDIGLGIVSNIKLMAVTQEEYDALSDDIKNSNDYWIGILE